MGDLDSQRHGKIVVLIHIGGFGPGGGTAWLGEYIEDRHLGSLLPGCYPLPVLG